MIPTTHRSETDAEPWVAQVLAAVRPPPDDFVAQAIFAGLRRRFAGVPSSLRLGRYVIAGRLGGGRLGVIYEAVDVPRARRVAIRVLRRGVAVDPAVTRLAHENVVEVLDLGTDHGSGRAWIAMELSDGVSLRRWMGQAPRSASEIRAVFRAAARGLGAAHAIGLAHGDFRAEHVFVGAGAVKVANFALYPAATPDDDAGALVRALAAATVDVGGAVVDPSAIA